MKSTILKKDKHNCIIQWSDNELGFGQISIVWNQESGRFILDSEYLGVDEVLKIIKSLNDTK